MSVVNEMFHIRFRFIFGRGIKNGNFSPKIILFSFPQHDQWNGLQNIVSRVGVFNLTNVFAISVLDISKFQDNP